jgi:hypothetical protein
LSFFLSDDDDPSKFVSSETERCDEQSERRTALPQLANGESREGNSSAEKDLAPEGNSLVEDKNLEGNFSTDKEHAPEVNSLAKKDLAPDGNSPAENDLTGSLRVFANSNFSIVKSKQV